MASSAESDGPPPVRPALQVLQADQKALFRDVDNERYADEHYLRGGFPDRAAVIQWFQRAIVRTFGKLTDTVPAGVLEDDQVLLACFITDADERRKFRPDPPSLKKARRVRDKFWAKALRPACRDAYRELTRVAGEYITEDTDNSWSDLEPEDQQYIAMRPGFQQIDREQADALTQLLIGFEDRDKLYDWVHELDDPTNSYIRGDVGALIENAADSDVALLLKNPPNERRAEWVREMFAINLLPAFAIGVGEMSTGELAARTRDPLEPIQG